MYDISLHYAIANSLGCAVRRPRTPLDPAVRVASGCAAKSRTANASGNATNLHRGNVSDVRGGHSNFTFINSPYGVKYAAAFGVSSSVEIPWTPPQGIICT